MEQVSCTKGAQISYTKEVRRRGLKLTPKFMGFSWFLILGWFRKIALMHLQFLYFLYVFFSFFLVKNSYQFFMS